MYCLSKSDSFISCNYINQQLMLLRLKHVSERWDMYENIHIKKNPKNDTVLGFASMKCFIYLTNFYTYIIDRKYSHYVIRHLEGYCSLISEIIIFWAFIGIANGIDDISVKDWLTGVLASISTSLNFVVLFLTSDSFIFSF